MRGVVGSLLVGLVVVSSIGCQVGPIVRDLPEPVFGQSDSQPLVVVKPPIPQPAPRFTGQPAPLPGPIAPPVANVPADWIRFSGQVRPWKYIIIHHSATAHGSAAEFNVEHKARGWDGLGYDFVIGNGRGSGDGLIEVGWRWTQQREGAHCKTSDNRFNDGGIGICLVGNFDKTTPTPAQMASLKRLVQFLAQTYHVPPDRVFGHGEAVATMRERGTECPGDHMNMPLVRQWVASVNWTASR